MNTPLFPTCIAYIVAVIETKGHSWLQELLYFNQDKVKLQKDQKSLNSRQLRNQDGRNEILFDKLFDNMDDSDVDSNGDGDKVNKMEIVDDDDDDDDEDVVASRSSKNKKALSSTFSSQKVLRRPLSSSSSLSFSSTNGGDRRVSSSKLTRKQSSSLRSRNQVINEWLTEENDSDTYADLNT